MSRCFPFPPPGYEKKLRLEDTNLLKEEKKKEKKHKKEKKEREKGEGKEKRDKERSDGKHREKKDKKEKQKDKKEKHRDKKDMEKDKSKDKEKSSNSETSRIADVPGSHNGVKLSTKEGKDKTFPVSNSEGKLRTKEGKDKIFSSDEKNHVSIPHFRNGEKSIKNNLLSWDTEDSRFVLELARRINEEEKVTTNQLVETFSNYGKKNVSKGESIPVQNPGDFFEHKAKKKDGQINNKSMDVQRIMDGVKLSENSMVQSFAGTAKSNMEVLPRAVDEEEKRRKEGKELAKEKDDKQRNKHKGKDGDKKSHSKDKDKDKDKEKERKKEKAEKNEQKKIGPGISLDVQRNDFPMRNSGQDKSREADTSYVVDLPEVMDSGLLSDHTNVAVVKGSEKKRKEIDMHSFLDDNEVRPKKLLRPAPHPLLENGRKLDAHQSPILFASEKHNGVPDIALNLKNGKEEMRNGLVESKSLPFMPPNPSCMPNREVLDKSRKAPHPDTKLLSQLLTVPMTVEWSGFDDQEWLFNKQEPLSRKHELGSSGFNEGMQVWSKALNIESTDIVALPYVLPY